MNKATKDLTEIAIFTSLLSVASILSVPIGNVPITLQTLVVMLIGLLLSPRNSVMTLIAYLLIGIIGVPVFALGRSGLGVILGPTGGFLISFVFAVFFIAKMKSVNIINNEIVRVVVILLIANIFIYIAGWTHFAVYMEFDIARTLGILWPYAIADVVKIVIATYVYLSLRKQIMYVDSEN